MQNSSARAAGESDLQQRADKLSELFSGGGKRDFKSVAPYLQGLSDADAKQLRAIYQQKTGRDLLRDATNYFFMEDRFSAFSILAPERIHEQSEPQPFGSGGKGIKMDPPSKEVLEGAEVKYRLDLSGEVGGNLRVSHLERGENVNLEKEGAEFTADYTADCKKDRDYAITFEARYGDGLPEFYTYKLTVRDAESKTSTELTNLAGTAPDSEMYVAYLDGQIAQTKQLISELETRRDQLSADIRNSIGNSSDKHDQVRDIEKQLKTLKNALPEMETARAEVSNAFADSVDKPIPLKAVLVARENGQAIPLQLYAKNLGGGKWAIVDVTNPTKPRTWTGEGILPTDALNAAWKNFVNGTNDLPPGQIAAVKPQGLGITNENQPWNSPSAGQSTLKQFANSLGLGSLALGVLGVGAIFGPGTQGAAVPLLLASGILGGGSAGANAADRAFNGSFKWNTTETALDVLGVVGGAASLGGLGAMTGAGRTILANGAKYTVQNLGNYTRIAQVAETGTNAAGGILIANQYVSAIDKVNCSPMSAERKAAETRRILVQAAAMGGLMVLGTLITSKVSKTVGSRSSSLSEELQTKILYGERVANPASPRGTSNKIIGGHSPQIKNDPNYAVEIIGRNADGTTNVKYVTQFPDGKLSKVKNSTLAPNSWSDDKIIQVTEDVGKSPIVDTRVRDGATMHRQSFNGVMWEVIKDSSGKIISSYPTGGIATPKGGW